MCHKNNKSRRQRRLYQATTQHIFQCFRRSNIVFTIEAKENQSKKTFKRPLYSAQPVSLFKHSGQSLKASAFYQIVVAVVVSIFPNSSPNPEFLSSYLNSFTLQDPM